MLRTQTKGYVMQVDQKQEVRCAGCNELHTLLEGVEANMASVSEMLNQIRRQLREDVADLSDG